MNSKSASPSDQARSVLTNRSSDEDEASTSQGETDSDLEPEQLVEKYLGLQKRLFEIDPEYCNHKTKGSKESKKTIHVPAPNHDRRMTQTIARLTAKLDKIKADILFDEGEAERRWEESRIDLAKEVAERRRLGTRDVAVSSRQTPSAGRLNPVDALKDDEVAPEMLAGLFTDQSVSTNDPDAVGSGGGEVVHVRDFGKWSGLSPRRILEEACKSRYCCPPIR